MNYLFELYDEQARQIDKEVNRINQQNNAIKPYLTSSFNLQFDDCLKTLVLDYEFDLDKVALHLYYLFPVYEQKITSRTVGVRWWQLMMENRLQRQMIEDRELINNNECNEQQQKQISKQEQQQQLVRRQSTNYQQLTSVYSYKQAMEHSLVLQQQQYDRLIMYKPKFIIDSQYKLQRYEMFDCQQQGNRENESDRQFENNNSDYNQNVYNFNNNAENQDNRQQRGIQSILRKVVNNQFTYDEFGSFISMANQQSSNNRIEIQQRNTNWWQQQICSSSSSQSQDFNQKGENEKEQNEQKINSMDNKGVSQQYEFDDNWDQYESD